MQRNRKGFTTVELVIVIAVIAILATVLIPIFSNLIGQANDSDALQEAKNAYKSYIIYNGATATEYMLYETDGRFVALQNGIPKGVHDSRKEAIKAMLDNKDTQEDESVPFTSLRVESNEQLWKIEKRKAVICFVFDDGELTRDEAYYEIFKEYGLVCDFALMTGEGHYRQIEDYLEYEKDGFGILSHGVVDLFVHKPELPAEFLETQFKSSLDQLMKDGFTSVRGWVTPASELHVSYLPALKKYYDYGFTVPSYNLQFGANESKTPYHTLNDSVYELHRVSIENNDVANIKWAIDETVKNTGILFFKKEGASPNPELNKLKEILDYVVGYIEKGECVVTNTSVGMDYYYQIDTSRKDDTAETVPS